MILARPMHDELAAAHEGRLALVNGFTNTNVLYSRLGDLLRRRGVIPDNLPHLHRLAMASDLTPTEYASSHSMMPAIRVACRDGEARKHGLVNDCRGKWNNRLSAQIDMAHCCPLCVEEDLRRSNFSWFRRMHHVLGFDWCPIHGSALHEIESPTPFARLPHQWLSDGLVHPVRGVYPAMPGDDHVVGRYIRIYMALLHRDHPIPASSINPAIAKRAKAFGVGVRASSNRLRLSDVVAASVPAAWLERHVPNWGAKIPRTNFPRLDTIVRSSTTVCPGDAYVLTSAVLCSSTSEALEEIMGMPAGASTVGVQHVDAPVELPSAVEAVV